MMHCYCRFTVLAAARSRDESLRLRGIARRALGQSALPESALKMPHEHAVLSLAGAPLLASSAMDNRIKLTCVSTDTAHECMSA